MPRVFVAATTVRGTMSTRFSDESAAVFIEQCLVEGVPVIAVVGVVDSEDEDQAQTAITAQIQRCPPAIVIDLRQVAFIGSAGLRVLVQSHADAEREGTRLVIVADQRAVLCPLAVTQVDRVLDVHRDVFDALAGHIGSDASRRSAES